MRVKTGPKQLATAQHELGNFGLAWNPSVVVQIGFMLMQGAALRCFSSLQVETGSSFEDMRVPAWTAVETIPTTRATVWNA
jgi:hypothetical protein